MSIDDVIGHERAIGLIKKAMSSGRVASAYLFAGEQGIGKKHTALNFASALNCKKTTDGCGEDDPEPCPSCRKMRAGSHPDLFVISPEKGVIKVEPIRGVEESLSLSAFEGGHKVVIIDDAETMHPSASNAFLKTLEEPPPSCVIILVTSSPEGLLETIRSRCVRINFRTLSRADTKAVIEKIAGPGTATEAAVRLSMGRPGLALEEDPIKERERFLESLPEITSPGKRASWKDRADIERWIDICLGLLRDMAVYKVTGREDGLIHSDMGGLLAGMCQPSELQVIIKCYGRLLRVREGLRFNLNKGITWNYVGAVMRESGIAWRRV